MVDRDEVDVSPDRRHATGCPDDDTLAAIETLHEAERARIVDHAATCDACRSIVGDLLGVSPTRAFAAAETLAATSAPGATSVDGGMPAMIDRYRIEERIGAGAMGVVYSGYDPELARPLAIKVLKRGGSPERMKREAQALAQLAHPNVVAVYDVGEEGGATFVAMALVDGENLRAWMQQPRSTEQILDAITQAARGLGGAHAAGIVHRDIKPDNIFVAKNGTVLVGDFGLARTSDELSGAADNSLLSSSELTRTGTLVGTPAYMAPEQVDGEAIAATDQFALCVTAWEALYGVRPFTGSTLGQLVEAVHRGPPVPPSTRRVPSHVRAAIRKGLAADPHDRHPSMAAFVTALGARRRGPLIAGAVIALAAAGGSAFALAMRAKSDAVEPAAACDAIAAPSGWPVPPQMPAEPRRVLGIVLDRYAADWQSLARSSCVAAANNELAKQGYAAVQRCLENRKDTMLWIGTRSDDVLGLAELLEPIETCRGRTEPAPSAELGALQLDLEHEGVRTRFSPERVTAADDLLARARKLGDNGTIAEASYLVGVARHARGVDATAPLQEALAAADRAGDDRLRTRASALLAIVSARSGRLAEAKLQHAAALAGGERANDYLTLLAIENANRELALAQRDRAAEIAAYRRIEALQLARFGEISESIIATRFRLSSTLGRVGDPSARSTLDLAAAALTRLVPSSSEETLAQMIVSEPNPFTRLPMQERLVEMLRRDHPELLYKELFNLGYYYELVGDEERALLTMREVLASKKEDGVLISAAQYALEIAERTEDPAMRKRELDDALGFLDQLSPAANPPDQIQSLRGRILMVAGRTTEAIQPLTAALAASEAMEPQNPFHMVIRSFSLAKALWEVGGQRERQRALALAEQAARFVPDARAEIAAYEQGALLPRIDRLQTKLEAWRRTHR